MNDYKFPGVYIGCPVEISTDPSESDKTLGWVFEANDGACNVISVLGRHHFDCWHADDPRCQTNSDVFQMFNDRGVFRLTEGEVQRRQLYDRMATLEQKLSEFFVQLREIGSQVRPNRATKPVRKSVEAPAGRPVQVSAPEAPRRRGRPRKHSFEERIKV